MRVLDMSGDYHMGEEEFERYSMGAMPEAEMAAFEEHLLICEPCQLHLAETDAYVAAMRQASTRFRGKAPRRWLTWPRVPRPIMVPALAGLAALIVAAGWWVSRADNGQSQPVAIELAATRGTAIESKAPAGRGLLLRLDLANLPASAGYRVEMVDNSGHRVWRAAGPARGPKADFKVQRMPPGVYFVRVYQPSGELLREYGFEVEDRMQAIPR